MEYTASELSVKYLGSKSKSLYRIYILFLPLHCIITYLIIVKICELSNFLGIIVLILLLRFHFFPMFYRAPLSAIKEINNTILRFDLSKGFVELLTFPILWKGSKYIKYPLEDLLIYKQDHDPHARVVIENKYNAQKLYLYPHFFDDTNVIELFIKLKNVECQD